MKPFNFLKLLLITTLFAQCTQFPSLPKFTELFENEKNEENEAEGGYQEYFEYSRKAALGDDWQRITNENEEKASTFKRNLMTNASSRANFAGGALQGDWYERGGSTVSGDMNAPAFWPATEEVFALSTSGTIYKGGLTGGAWSVQNDTENFNNQILAVINNGGSKRLIAAKSDHKIYYSDNDGVNWAASNGIVNQYNWGYGGKKLVIFNNGTMYYLQHVWLDAPWGQGAVLYRSTNNGVTWTNIKTFGGRTEYQVTMWSPYNSNELYVLDNGDTVHSLSGTGSVLSVLNANTTLTTGGSYSLTGHQSGGSTTFYALHNSTTLFKSTDNCATWTNVKALNPTAWSIGINANPFVANTIYYGAVEFWKSVDAGATFTVQNTWQSYYGNNNMLHADMVGNRFFEKTDGTKFMLVCCHGGIYYVPSPFSATSNLTLTGIRSAEYYDVVTVGGTIFAGAQDQGNQRFAGGVGTNIQTASQLISGDYVRLNTSVNGTKYWQEYPGGSIHYYDNPLVQQYTSAQGAVTGNQRVNIQQWVVPTCNWSVASANSILVGGGVSSSGSGSHIIKMTYNGTSTLTEYQYPFDFLANSVNGYISAIDHSPADANYMYVGLNTGQFYYSSDAGTTWNTTVGFTGAVNGWNYGSFVHASRLNKNLVFFCGGGGKIYKSSNGGVNFADMSVGLPNTFVSEVSLNGNETLLFAATDAGPYVCVLNTGQWYSLAGAATPVKSYSSVEFVAAENVMRFTTFGRGVWDFKITAQPLPISFSHFVAKATDNQQVSITWKTELESNMDYFEVERSYDGVDFFALRKINANNKPSRYDLIDQNPRLNATNYYRIKSVEKSGKIEYTNIEAVNITRNGNFVNVYPTLLKNGNPIFVEIENDNQTFSVFDQQGKIILNQRIEKGINQIEMSNLTTGYYFYAVKDENGRLVKSSKVLMN